MIKTIYKGILDNSSPNVRNKIQRSVNYLQSKPRIANNTKVLDKGLVVISADFELAWAFQFSKQTKDPLKKAQLARKNMPLLLDLFDTYNIPITWATVGHLFLDSCKKGDHDWMSRIDHFDNHWLFNKGDWYQNDPYSNCKRDNSWYAPDLVEKILNSKASHEIGCHTFSHINCRDKVCSANVLRDELEAWNNSASKFGIKAKSFVFPGGTYGNFDVLKEFDYKIYRVKNNSFEMGLPLFDKNGLLQTFSTGAFGEMGVGLDPQIYIKKFKRILDKAAKNKTVCHLWFHPSVNQNTVKEVMPEVIRYIAELREKGIMEVVKMGELDSVKYRDNI